VNSKLKTKNLIIICGNSSVDNYNFELGLFEWSLGNTKILNFLSELDESIKNKEENLNKVLSDYCQLKLVDGNFLNRLFSFIIEDHFIEHDCQNVIISDIYHIEDINYIEKHASQYKNINLITIFLNSFNIESNKKNRKNELLSNLYSNRNFDIELLFINSNKNVLSDEARRIALEFNL
jgi:hypothetical protein